LHGEPDGCNDLEVKGGGVRDGSGWSGVGVVLFEVEKVEW
jgi:hypothetical protein